MVHSADSRIQGHAFRCHLFSPAVRDHASTNPASFSPWARPQAKRCSTTKALPNHRASGWLLLDPLFASGSERAEQENRALIANQYVRGIRDKLRRTAHGCVLLWSNTHQVTKTEKAPSYQSQSSRPFALCATSAFRLTTVRLQTSVARAFALS